MTFPRLFPALMPGETIHSAISRYHLLAGNVSASTSIIELFGNRTTSVTSDFPSGLGELMMLAGNQRLIDDHTLLPLFSSFIGESRSEATRKKMLDRGESSLKFACGVINAGFERYRAWRYCPDCMLKDSLKYGIAYWHIIHQAAGVQACPEHRVPLYTLSIYGEILGGAPLMLPRSTEIQASASQYRFDSAQLSKAADLATLLHWGLTYPAETAQLLSRNFINVTLCDKGLIHRNRVKADQLAHHIENALQGYPLDDEFRRLGAQCQCFPPWILGMIRRQNSTHHPLFYFALLALLDVSVSDLNVFIQEEISGEVLSSSTAIDPIRHAVSKEMRIQKRAQFSSSAKVVGFKKAQGYYWLYRNDREWLSAYVRSHTQKFQRQGKVDWTVRDKTLPLDILRAKAEILSFPGRPIQITQRSLARHLCIPLTTWRRTELLPRTSSALSQAEESAHDFQLRRVSWASKTLVDGGTVHTRYSILRLAGIRVLLLSEVELEKYCG